MSEITNRIYILTKTDSKKHRVYYLRVIKPCGVTYYVLYVYIYTRLSFLPIATARLQVLKNIYTIYMHITN